MTDTMAERRGPGRPPKPRDADGNIIRGEQGTPEPEVSSPPPEPEVPASLPQPAPEPESEPAVDDWATVIIAGLEHFASLPGDHHEEAKAMMGIHRAFRSVKPGPPQPFVTECTGCGAYRCEGIPDAPNCPTCGHPFPVWEKPE